jgi:hypothetical protein
VSIWESSRFINSSVFRPVSRSSRTRRYVRASWLAVSNKLVHSASKRISGRGAVIFPFGIVRHVTHHSIPGTARRNEEKRSWVISSTLRRKTRGKAAYEKSHRDLTDDRGQGGQDPCGMNKATLLKVSIDSGRKRGLWESGCYPYPSLQWLSIPTVALS